VISWISCYLKKNNNNKVITGVFWKRKSKPVHWSKIWRSLLICRFAIFLSVVQQGYVFVCSEQAEPSSFVPSFLWALFALIRPDPYYCSSTPMSWESRHINNNATFSIFVPSCSTPMHKWTLGELSRRYYLYWQTSPLYICPFLLHGTRTRRGLFTFVPRVIPFSCCPILDISGRAPI
jgi:hypothetical protein